MWLFRAAGKSALQWPTLALRLRCDGKTRLGDLLTSKGFTHQELSRAEKIPRYRHALAGGNEEAVHLTLLGILKAEWQREDEKVRWQAIALKALDLPKRVRDFATSAKNPAGYYEQSPDLADAYARVADHPYRLEDLGPDAEPSYRTLGIFGVVGSGKTILSAVWLVEGVRVSEDPGLFIKARDLAEEVNRDGRSALRFAEIPRLVIDGIGSEKEDLNRSSVRALTRVLDARTDADVLTCFTTSRTVPELQRAFGDYGYSRLMDRALGVVLSGSDRRLHG